MIELVMHEWDRPSYLTCAVLDIQGRVEQTSTRSKARKLARTNPQFGRFELRLLGRLSALWETHRNQGSRYSRLARVDKYRTLWLFVNYSPLEPRVVNSNSDPKVPSGRVTGLIGCAPKLFHSLLNYLDAKLGTVILSRE